MTRLYITSTSKHPFSRTIPTT